MNWYKKAQPDYQEAYVDIAHGIKDYEYNHVTLWAIDKNFKFHIQKINDDILNHEAWPKWVKLCKSKKVIAYGRYDKSKHQASIYYLDFMDYKVEHVHKMVENVVNKKFNNPEIHDF